MYFYAKEIQRKEKQKLTVFGLFITTLEANGGTAGGLFVHETGTHGILVYSKKSKN